jgi:hypothetical protein
MNAAGRKRNRADVPTSHHNSGGGSLEYAGGGDSVGIAALKVAVASVQFNQFIQYEVRYEVLVTVEPLRVAMSVVLRVAMAATVSETVVEVLEP